MSESYTKVCKGVESLLLCNVGIVFAVLKVGAVDRHRFDCLSVLGDSGSMKSGWSQSLVQVIGVVAWSGIWRRLKRWMHILLRLDGRCPTLFSPWLTGGGGSMWPRNADESPREFVVGELEYIAVFEDNTGEVKRLLFNAIFFKAHRYELRDFSLTTHNSESFYLQL